MRKQVSYCSKVTQLRNSRVGSGTQVFTSRLTLPILSQQDKPSSSSHRPSGQTKYPVTKGHTLPRWTHSFHGIWRDFHFCPLCSHRQMAFLTWPRPPNKMSGTAEIMNITNFFNLKKATIKTFLYFKTKCILYTN